MYRPRLLLALFAAGLMISSCTSAPRTPGSFNFSANPDEVTLCCDLPPDFVLSDDIVITINRTNLSGDISFSVEGVPEDILASFAPNPVPGDTTTLRLTHPGDVIVNEGDYPLTIRAVGPGGQEQVLDVLLKIRIPVVEDTLTITSIQGPGTLTYNGAAGQVSVFWEGTPTFPVEASVSPVSCGLDNCGSGTVTFDTEVNPLVFTYSCTAQGDDPPAGSVTNQVVLTDDKGLVSNAAQFTVTCVP